MCDALVRLLVIAILINEWAAHKHELAAWNTDGNAATASEAGGGEMCKRKRA